MQKKSLLMFVVVAIVIILVASFVIAKRPVPEASKPECSDKIDNDGDGLTDWRSDSGCVDRYDDDESDCGDAVCEGGEDCSTCEADCGVCQDCGNNEIEGDEVCDGTDLGGESCTSQGFDGGDLACNQDCDGFVTTACWDNSCSDTDSWPEQETQGTVSGLYNNEPYSETDYCNSSTALVEYYCFGDLHYSQLYICDQNYTGCSAGACVE